VSNHYRNFIDMLGAGRREGQASCDGLAARSAIDVLGRAERDDDLRHALSLP
jgi:hypothetical protein